MNKKELYGGLLSCITAVAGIDNAKKFDTLFRDHKKLNLKNPQTLSDKVSYIELHEQSPLAASCTDKYAVREYVTNKGLGDILVPIYGGGYTRFEDINLTELPDSFAIKATHGCKMNYLVPDKSKFDSENVKKKSKDGWTLHTERTRWSLITLRFHTGSTLKSILKRQINLWTTSFIALMGNRSLC